MHLLDALNDFLFQLEADGRSPHTRDQYSRHIRLLAAWCADAGLTGDVGDFDHRDVARFLASDTAKGRAGGGEKLATSANALRSSIRCFFRYLHQSGEIPTNPARMTRRAICGTPPPRGLDDQDRERLLAAVDAAEGEAGRRDRLLVRLLLGVGMRIGAALAIDIEHVDLVRAEIEVHKAKYGQRDVVLMPRALAEEMPAFIGGRLEGPLFRSASGARLSIRHAQRRFEHLVSAAGLARPVTLHGLRHTFALGIYEMTRDLLVVQTALRHRTVESTRVYAQPRLTDVRAALEA